MLRSSYRVFTLLVFVMVAGVMVAGSPVSAEAPTGYQVPYQIWNCYPNPGYCNYPPGYQPYPGYFNGDYYTSCQPSNGNFVQCSGYLYEDPSGCVELVVTATSAYGLLSNQYYTLHNLPSSYTIGSWVTVTGTLYQGYNYAQNGAACPGNYINVNTLS